MADKGYEPTGENITHTHFDIDEMQAERAAMLSEENLRLKAELAELRAAFAVQHEPRSSSALQAAAPVPNDGRAVGSQRPTNGSFASDAVVSGHGPDGPAQSEQSNEQTLSTEAADPGPGPGDRGLDVKSKFLPGGGMPYDGGMQKLIEKLVEVQIAFVKNQQDFLTNQIMQSVEIPQFSGNGTPAFEDWFDRVTSVKTARRCTSERMYGDVRLSLVDPAFSAVANDPAATDTYHKLIRFLQHTFGVRYPKAHYIELLSKLVQMELETGPEFVGRFSTLRRRLNDALPDGQTYDETTLRPWFQNGLRPGFKNLLEQHIKFSRGAVSLNDALALVKDNDELVQRMEANRG